MTFRACAPLCSTIAIVLALPLGAPAQTSYRVTAFGGAYHASLVDPISSQLRYSGGGLALGLAAARETPGSVLDLAAEYQRSHLGSALTGSGDLPREVALFAGVQARRLWAGRGLAGGRLRAGVALRGELALRDHWYSEPPVAFSYLIGMVALGPAAEWTRPLGKGELRVQALLPVAGVVYRPYCDVESVDGNRLEFRLAALNRLRAPAGGIDWAVPLGLGGVRAVAGWRFSYLRYRDYTVYREARQTLAASLELPLGGRP